MSAKLNEIYRTICNATHGIPFFGTPHRGGNGAKLGDIAAGVARALLQNLTNTFMGALKKQSVLADNLANDFRHQLEDYRIINFYETLPFKKLGLVSKVLKTLPDSLTVPRGSCQTLFFQTFSRTNTIIKSRLRLMSRL